MDLDIDGYDEAVEIGRGGFGVVYRARQSDLDRTVAIKVLAGTLDDHARRRFDRERRAMGALSGHPHIVTIYGSGLTALGQPYIVMEYLPGGSLADRLEDGPLQWQEAMEVGVKLAGALEVAHQIGVLHRDIKPENALVSAYDEPKLADFGIARIEGMTGTRSGVITASVAHAAPEVLEGRPASKAADVYSLASTIYALIAGHPVFARDTDESMLPLYRRIASDPVPDLRPLGIPDETCTALERAMDKDPTARTASANELAATLSREARTSRPSPESANVETAERAPVIGHTVIVDRPGRRRRAASARPPNDAAPPAWPQAATTDSEPRSWPRSSDDRSAIGSQVSPAFQFLRRQRRWLVGFLQRHRRWLVGATAVALVAIVVIVAITSGGDGSGSRRYEVTEQTSIRTEPYVPALSVRDIAEGTELKIICQDRGMDGGIWDKLPDGMWVSDYAVNTAGQGNSFSPSIPRC